MTVSRAAGRLDAAIMRVAEVIADLDEHDARGHAQMLRRLDHSPNGAKQQLAAVTGELAKRLNRIICREWGERQGTPTLVVERVGVLQATWPGKTTRWEGERLARRIAARAADRACVNPLTGEILDEIPPPAVIAEYVVNELIACAGLDNANPAWRKGEIKGRNLDPDDYLTRSGESFPSVKWSG